MVNASVFLKMYSLEKTHIECIVLADPSYKFGYEGRQMVSMAVT
jgi:hypothetical protein